MYINNSVKLRFKSVKIGVMISALIGITPISFAETTPSQADKAEPVASTAQYDNDIDQLTTLIYDALPIADAFTIFKKEIPLWPFQDKPDLVDKNQLQCVRHEMTKENYRKYLRNKVQLYVIKNPEQALSDIKLLAATGNIPGKLFIAGFESNRRGNTDPAPDINRILSASTPEQTTAAITFMKDPQYAELRKLIDDGTTHSDATDVKTNSRAENPAVKQISLFSLQAMTNCHVPMSHFSEINHAKTY
ncbi:MAG: hypothetical protein NVSMB40_00210 [Aquirhabdus sp.]